MHIDLFFEYGFSSLWYTREGEPERDWGIPKEWRRDRMLVELDKDITDMWLSFFENRPDAFYFRGPKDPLDQERLKHMVKLYIDLIKKHMKPGDTLTDQLTPTLSKPLKNDHPKWDID